MRRCAGTIGFVLISAYAGFAGAASLTYVSQSFEGTGVGYVDICGGCSPFEDEWWSQSVPGAAGEDLDTTLQISSSGGESTTVHGATTMHTADQLSLAMSASVLQHGHYKVRADSVLQQRFSVTAATDVLVSGTLSYAGGSDLDLLPRVQFWLCSDETVTAGLCGGPTLVSQGAGPSVPTASIDQIASLTPGVEYTIYMIAVAANLGAVGSMDLTLTVVPEPETALLLGLGLLGLALGRAGSRGRARSATGL